jgi:fucose permease
VFKQLGETYELQDQYVTLVASISLSFNLVARLTGGVVLDKLSFRFYYGFIMALAAVLSFTYVYVASDKIMFFIYLSLTDYIGGSTSVSLPIFYAKIFGPEAGSQAYSICCLANPSSAFVFSFIV